MTDFERMLPIKMLARPKNIIIVNNILIKKSIETISFHHHGHKKTYQDVYLFFFKPCGLNLKMNSCYVPKDLFDRIEVGDPIFVAYNKFFPVPFNAYQGTYTGNYFYTIDVR